MAIESAILEVMGTGSPKDVNEITMTCINNMLAPGHGLTESKVSSVEISADTSKDVAGMLTVVMWTVGALRARLKRQPNPQIPGFPNHLRHAWSGLLPAREALQVWIEARNEREEEAARKLLEIALSKTIIFTEGSTMGMPPSMSRQGQDKLLGMLVNAAEGLSSNLRGGRSMHVRRRNRIRLNVQDDHSLLAVWERVNASLNSLYKTDAMKLKTAATAAANSTKSEEDQEQESKGETFASKAAASKTCAVCWDDLNPEKAVEQNNGDEEAPVILNFNSDAVKMPQCGHTLCAECTYQWLKVWTILYIMAHLLFAVCHHKRVEYILQIYTFGNTVCLRCKKYSQTYISKYP